MARVGRMKRSLKMGWLGALLMAGNAAMAEEVPDFAAETLTGDWGGRRTSAYEKGIALDVTHKSDLLANVSGGLRQGSVWLMNTEFGLMLDMEKLGGWAGGSAFLQYHFQHGDQPKNFNGTYVGSFSGVSNIETGVSTGQFFQAWVQQSFAEDKWSILAGLYAVDSEFLVTESSGLFIQPPYGMSAEMAQGGRNGPPIFPMGALGMRIKYSGEGYYAQAALTDGVPGDPNNPHGTQIRLDKGDGTLAVFETGYTPEVPEGTLSKTAVGFWRYTARANDLIDLDAFGNPVQRQDRGFYVLTEHTLYSESDAQQGLRGFARFGVVNKDVHQADWSTSMGLNYQGLFDGRDDDAAGIAITASHASDKYRQRNAAKAFETVVELTYRAQIMPGVAVQPVVQRIINPNMDATIPDVWMAGVRFVLSL